MAISDIAGNAFAGGSAPMLGFVDPPAAAEVLNLRMYDFLIKPIREADLREGKLFVERYLQGPQEVWETIQTDIFRLIDLWDVVRIPDEFLKFLKNIVGWTPDLERPITDRLDDTTLRRLISVSVALWKIRGVEPAYSSSILALVLTRLRIWNWFDLRWILDNTIMGEDHQGRDPYILPTAAQQVSDIRIVDGALGLDRTLLLNMLKLFRPSGERLNVYWIDFLDLFIVDGDNSQWMSASVVDIAVADRLLSLSDDSGEEEVQVDVEGSLLWESYVAYWRVRGTQRTPTPGEYWGVQFYWQDVDNYYMLLFDPSFNTMVLWEVVSGAPAVLAGYSFATDLEQLYNDVFYGVRVHVENVPAGTRIRVYVDNLERIDFTDTVSPFTRGTIGLIHVASATIELSEIELWQLPLDTDFIDINEGIP